METKILQINNEPDIEIVSLNTICRLCANQNERLMGIFSEEGVSNDLFNKINSYLPIQVTASDNLPQQCCWNCTTTLLAWHELVVTTTEVDKKFRSSEVVSHKLDAETGSADNSMGGDNDACDVEIESKASTNLHDFSPPKPLKSPRKRKKEEPCFLQESPSMDPYITGMEREMIVPELVHPESEESDEDKDIKNLESEEETPYVGCEYCNALFFSNESLTEHMREWHPEELEKQNMAPKIEANIKKEKRKHHKLDQEAISAAKVVVDGKIYYNCRECGKNLHSPYTYSWHMRIHTGERPYVCDLCGKQFRVSQGLVRHLRETHEGIKKFACDLCGRMFATRRNVEEHRRIHTNERPYVCDLCGKSFKQKASLFVHKRSHKDFFPFKCSYCDMGFRTKPPLMVHITRHTGEKPFKCDICGRCFRIKYELKRHRLIHSDAKPWVCNVCGVSFRQKRYLKNHVKSNHALTS